MSTKKKGGYADKHPAGAKVNEKIEAAVTPKAEDGGVTCAAAHAIAGDLKVPPEDVGATLDLMELKIQKCQLGLFGYTPNKKVVTPAETIDSRLESALREHVSDNRLSCLDCWAVADRLQIKRMEAASVCEALGIKISPCQLGAF